MEGKSQQIPLMKEIYRKASNVLIWLGTESEGSKEVMKYFARIGQKFLDRWGQILEPQVEQHDQIHGAENKALREDVYNDPIMEKTNNILVRPRFSRRWIIQEVALARKATVHCGNEEVD